MVQLSPHWTYSAVYVTSFYTLQPQRSFTNCCCSLLHTISVSVWHLESTQLMGPTGCSETSVHFYRTTLHHTQKTVVLKIVLLFPTQCYKPFLMFTSVTVGLSTYFCVFLITVALLCVCGEHDKRVFAIITSRAKDLITVCVVSKCFAVKRATFALQAVCC
jgi:hypothetical protein